jgi:acetyl-CoA carboxylase carboxyl transferase subunit alpha
MKITSESLKQNELVDIVVKEPLGGAHRDPDQTAERLGVVIQEQLQVLDCLTTEELLRQRDTRLRSFGRFKDES